MPDPVANSGAAPAADPKAAPAADPVNQLKSEMNRKFDNFGQTLSELKQTLQAFAPKPAPAAPQKKLGDMMFDDPESAADTIVKKAVDTALGTVNTRLEAQQRQQAVLYQIAQEYPEAAQQGSEFQKKMVERYNALPKEEQAALSSIKAVAHETAIEMGLVPASRRSKDDDTFSLGGSRGGSQGRSGGGQKTQVTDEMLRFAELLGRPVNDPEYIKRLDKTASTRNFRKYE